MAQAHYIQGNPAGLGPFYFKTFNNDWMIYINKSIPVPIFSACSFGHWVAGLPNVFGFLFIVTFSGFHLYMG